MKSKLLVIFFCVMISLFFSQFHQGTMAEELTPNSILSLATPENMPIHNVTPTGYPEPIVDGKIIGLLPTPERFHNPPKGFGEVPFWWWSGDSLDHDRLAWQIRKLHEKGVTGMQINYAHRDTPGWPTFPNSPEIFSPDWWNFWASATSECRKYGMGIGLSTYTLDWTHGDNLFNKIVYNDPEFHTKTLHAREVTTDELIPSENSIGFWYYVFEDGKLVGDGIKIDPLQPFSLKNRTETVQNSNSRKIIRIWEFYWHAESGTLNPIHPQSGARVIEKFFQPFENHNPTRDAQGLNWFFNDELRLGVPGQPWWNEGVDEVFHSLKGYDLFSILPGLFTDIGPRTAKIRLDYSDVQMYLTEKYYFRPIYLWHYQRGLIYGCDNNGRGLNPTEYGDYFRAIRWYSAPGHDTPGGHADFIKGKVSSSIANLYRRPRVWLEGYHSLGWGASPNLLMEVTNENFAYGCTLLNLHGLYYTTHGSMWEWAPPCYHFRMPYWKHMGTFLKNFERLSYILSQGVWQSEVAIMYPTSPGMAGMAENQQHATQTAFDVARQVYQSGRDVTFMDDQSLLRAEIRNGKLCVSDMEFPIYILPGVKAIRWDVMQKLVEFAQAGGLVVCLECVPSISDRIGAEDAELGQLTDSLFTLPNARGILLENWREGDGNTRFNTLVQERFPVDIRLEGNGNPTGLKFIHRRNVSQNTEQEGTCDTIQDVYFVMGVSQNTLISFRTAGEPEWWDSMTGQCVPMEVIRRTRQENGDVFTTVKMPVSEREAALIVFTQHCDVGETKIVDNTLETPQERATKTILLDGSWRFCLIPTMDNYWGDFRLPVTPDNRWIGAEARCFRYEELLDADVFQFLLHPNSAIPKSVSQLVTHFDTQASEKKGISERLYGVGTQFFLQSRAEGESDFTPSEPYRFSWRSGIEMEPGHQGWHGSKKNITDHFIALGVPQNGHNEILYVDEVPRKTYRLTTYVRHAGPVTIQKGGILPEKVWLDGQEIAPETQYLELSGLAQKLVLEYTTTGRGFWVLEKGEVSHRVAQSEEAETQPKDFDWYNTDGNMPKTPQSACQSTELFPHFPLSMTWFRTNCVPFEPYAINGTEQSSPRVGIYGFSAPAGLQKLVFTLDEKTLCAPMIFINGTWVSQIHETQPVQPRTRRWVLNLAETSLKTIKEPAQVTILAPLPDSLEGGALFAEPIRLETGEGILPKLENFRDSGTVMENYSGGVLYTKTFMLSDSDFAEILKTDAKAILDLTSVFATAEVRLNGRSIRTLISAPWRVDVTDALKPGENVLEVEVFNTLSNHYQTIPNRYRGNPDSGLLGPVELKISKVVPNTAVEQKTRIFREQSRRMKSLKLGDLWDLHAMQAGTKKTVSICRHEFLELPSIPTPIKTTQNTENKASYRTLFHTDNVKLASSLNINIPTEILGETIRLCVTNPVCHWTITSPQRVYLTNGEQKIFPFAFFEDMVSNCGPKNSGDEIVLSFPQTEQLLAERNTKTTWSLVIESGITSWETPQDAFSLEVYVGEKVRLSAVPDVMNRLCRAKVEGDLNATSYTWEVPGSTPIVTETPSVTFRIPELAESVTDFSIRVTIKKVDGTQATGETMVKLASLPAFLPAEKDADGYDRIILGTCFYPAVPDDAPNSSASEEEKEFVKKARDGMCNWEAPRLPCKWYCHDYVTDFLAQPYGNMTVFWPLTVGNPVESQEKGDKLFQLLAKENIYAMTIYQHWGKKDVMRIANLMNSGFAQGTLFLNNNLGEYASYLYQGSSSATACGVPTSENLNDCKKFFIDDYISRGVHNYQRDYPYVFSTSGATVANYELAGGVGFMCTELYAIGAQNLAFASAEMRGAARKWKPEFWGGWLAHEWQTTEIPYDAEQKFTLLRMGLYQQYLMGSHMMILESGTQTTQAGAYTKTLTENAPRRNYAYEDEPPMRYRKEMRTFYEWLKCPENRRRGTPITPIALAQGNNDAFVGINFAGMPVWAQHETAKKNPNWCFGVPEQTWTVAQNVFFPLGEDTVAPYKNRWLAGSPYGQVDVVGVDTFTRLSDLTRYNILIFSGWNTMTPEIFALLTKYVEQGGTVVLATPHLSCRADREGKEYTADNLIHGGNLVGLIDLKITGRTLVSGDYIAKFELLSNTSSISELEIIDKFAELPLVVRQKRGKGTVYLFLSWEYPGKDTFAQSYERLLQRVAQDYFDNSNLYVETLPEIAPYLSWAVYENCEDAMIVYILNLDQRPHNCVLKKGSERRTIHLAPLEMKIIPITHDLPSTHSQTMNPGMESPGTEPNDS